MAVWFETIHTRGSEHAGRVFSMASRQPSWVVRWTLTAGFIAMLALLSLILLPILLIMVVVFLVASTVARIRSSGRSGRENVRVIVRSDE